MDGEATGRIKISLSNWTGVAYKVPRSDLVKCKNREDLQGSGTYFLFGEEEESGKPVVYVGQAGTRKKGGMYSRIVEHTRNEEKNYWTEVVMITTSNNSLGSTEISYLENKFWDMAVEAGRYLVKNDKEPNPGNITEEKMAEMEEFIGQAKLLLATLGYKVFDKESVKTKEEGGEGLELFLQRKSGKSGRLIEARCVRNNDGFVVLKGSMVELIDSPNIYNTVKKARDQYMEEKSVDENGILQKEIFFKNPTYAGVFVVGGTCNGQTSWKTKDGKTLKEYDESVLADL